MNLKLSPFRNPCELPHVPPLSFLDRHLKQWGFYVPAPIPWQESGIVMTWIEEDEHQTRRSYRAVVRGDGRIRCENPHLLGTLTKKELEKPEYQHYAKEPVCQRLSSPLYGQWIRGQADTYYFP